MPELEQLRDAALEIFRAALRGADARAAVRRAVCLQGPLLNVCETTINLAEGRRPVYSIAIGKAAHAMAPALDEILGARLTAGILAGLAIEQSRDDSESGAVAKLSSSERWRVYAGGHPLPNEESLKAARAAFEIMRRAEDERALIIFLISGGGSALIEWPRDEGTTLAELREANRTLVNCGASIAEINAVRRAISSVKGGGLTARAPHADQLSLIISDTNKGDESNVASGPTLAPTTDAPDAASVVARYELASRLPSSILRVIAQTVSVKTNAPCESLRQHHVLLDNEAALAAAADEAHARGFVVEFASDIVEQEIASGCTQLYERLLSAHARVARTGKIVCLLSGGEFACPVRGAGMGGRSGETALRLALAIGERRERDVSAGLSSHIVALSAGTDGIDGNGPAAGAICDETTLRRAHALGQDARAALAASDSYSFFQALNDSIMIGPTETNVRDVRVLLAG